MIVDIPRFVAAERPYWDELRTVLDRMDTEPERRLALEEIQRLHYLYERCSAGLARLDTFSTDPDLRTLLESLVSRAYTEIHETRTPTRLRWKAMLLAFPRAFREMEAVATWEPFDCPSALLCWAVPSAGLPSAWTPAPRPC